MTLHLDLEEPDSDRCRRWLYVFNPGWLKKKNNPNIHCKNETIRYNHFPPVSCLDRVSGNSQGIASFFLFNIHFPFPFELSYACKWHISTDFMWYSLLIDQNCQEYLQKHVILESVPESFLWAVNAAYMGSNVPIGLLWRPPPLASFMAKNDMR